MFNSIVENLVSIGWSMLIFLSAYLANVTFSLWYNIKLLHEPFDREKLINSAYKIATFVIGLTLLDRKSTRLNSSHTDSSRMPSSA